MSHALIIDKATVLYKGIHSWNISQSHPLLTPHIDRGICLAASCYYMSMHKRGSSLREGLGMYQKGKNNFISLDINAIKFIASQQTRFGCRTNTDTFRSWLNDESKLRKIGYGRGDVTTANLSASIRGILPAGGYMMFIISPAEGPKHAVVAYFGAKKRNQIPVRFFDINVGEFLFRDHVRFLFFFDWLLRCVYGNNKAATYEFQHFM